MMACFVFFTLLLGELFLISSGEGVTFCVKLTESGSCLDRGCQKCETLQYYLDNVDETINQYDNVTLVLKSGTHNVCLSDYLGTAPIRATVMKMAGENRNVTVMDICSLEGQYCLLSFLQIHSTLFVENIKFLNYICIWDSDNFPYGKRENAANVILKDCLFQDSSITFKKLIAEECTFLHSEVFTVHTAEVTNCTFSNSYLLALGEEAMETQTLLESCHICESYVDITTGSVTIVGNTYISSSNAVNNFITTFYLRYSSAALSGNVTFMNNIGVYGGAMQLDSSILNITAGANVTFINNTASYQGGAIYLLRLSKINVAAGANLTFVNNSALDKGGAIYVHPGVTPVSLVGFSSSSASLILSGCIFSETDHIVDDHSKNLMVNFSGNKATKGGNDIYGASLSACSISSHSSGTSSAASDPLKVCLCESLFKPQCNGWDTINLHDHNFANMSLKVYPGESFTVPIFLVGLDMSTTTGVLYSYIIKSEHSRSTGVKLDSTPENGHVISNNKQCTSMNYSLSTNYTSEINVTMYLVPINIFQISGLEKSGGICYDNSSCYGTFFMSIFINITLLPCPPGFTLNGHCDCYLYHVVFDNCVAVNETGYFSWSSNAWASIYEDGILYDTRCPFDYCSNKTGQLINLLNDSDTQCAFNRAGRLCGGCRENYSLAIGSSHCIQCPNNNNLAIVIFFAAEGFILVFFITALNLTVSQGMVNGLIFYANIVWTYQSIFFPPYQEGYAVMALFKAFIAWVNLDFGIETCFISGLTAFWKTWLQFIFPFYIWVIAGLIIVTSRYSTRLTRLLGNRTVPVLDTFFLLSYMKLLRLVVTALEFSYLEYTDQNSTVTHSMVWSVDGNLLYFGHPHILLFLAGLATLVILCLPYTMLLLLMQWLRRLPHCKLTNWIMRFHPVYDAYFAPLKHKHQYWFGVLLLARVILLLTFVSTFAIPQYVNLLLLLIVGAILTFYVAVVQPYKSTVTLLLQSTFFINLNLLAGFVVVGFLSNQPMLQTGAVGLSTGVAFVQFCAIVLYNVIEILKRCQCRAGCCNCDRHNAQELWQEEDINDFVDSYDRHPGGSDVDFTTPLLNNTARNTDTRPTY